MADYRATTEIPARVVDALRSSAYLGFQQSCTAEVGRVLRLLVALARSGVIGEIGTGAGVGSAWLLEGLRHDQAFVSIESDPDLHRRAEALFQDRPNARFLQGDWRELLVHGPFGLLFVDAADAKDGGAGDVINALEVGGMAILDDFTPESHWPEEWRGRTDTRREFWLNDVRLEATEILTTSASSMILARRIA